jgi:hypothetical protein
MLSLSTWASWRSTASAFHSPLSFGIDDAAGLQLADNSVFLGLFWKFADVREHQYGARGRNRTTDTAIFSRGRMGINVLFHLIFCAQKNF